MNLPMLGSSRRSFSTPVYGHWHKLVDNFSTSPLEFYTALETALQKREIPELSTSRTEYYESGYLSAARVYFQIKRKRLAFDVCAAPFGTGFFFSWRLTEPKKSYKAQGCLVTLLLLFLAYFILLKFEYQGCLMALLVIFGALFMLVFSAHGGWLISEDIILDIPYLGALYEYFFDPDTYYKEDTRLMYQEMVHGAVLEVVDETLAKNGLRALAPEDTKPVTRSLVG